jgi:prevent-host-death family protein
MTPVKMHKAKTDFSKLIARVEKGEEIIIARGDKPVAKIVPITGKLPVASLYGAMKGKIFMPDSFFDPLIEEENAGWEDDGLLGPPA